MIAGPIFETELALIEDRSPEKARMIEQYRAVAGKFVELWDELYLRTETGDWREDGIGSCHTSPHLFETYVGGFITGEIEKLWDARSNDDPIAWDDSEEVDPPDSCQHHQQSKGCILGDLKSPRCLSHTDKGQRSEISDNFGIELPDFRTPLVQIQHGGMDLTGGDCSLHPEHNDELVERTIAETEELIAHVKTFPMLATELAV